MSKSKYTSGPWKYVNGADTKLSMPDSTMVYIEVGQTRIASLDLCGVDPNYPESELRCNANLMATSPEVLTAAEALLNTLPPNRHNMTVYANAIEDLRLAITKAKGSNENCDR